MNEREQARAVLEVTQSDRDAMIAYECAKSIPLNPRFVEEIRRGDHDGDRRVQAWAAYRLAFASSPRPTAAEQGEGVREDDCPYCGGVEELEAVLSDGKRDYVPCPHPCHRLAAQPNKAEAGEALRALYDAAYKDGADGDYNPDTALARLSAASPTPEANNG